MAQVSTEEPRHPALGDRRTLFFLHIPKTAGITITSLLDEVFEEDEIFQPNDWRDAPEAIEDMSALELARIRCVRGHFWYGPGDRGVHDRISADPVVMTMLRDPVARVVSVYQHVMRWPQHWLRVEIGLAAREKIPLLDFVQHPATQGEIWNLQTRLIVGDIPGNPVQLVVGEDGLPQGILSGEELLARGTAKLDSFAWVGTVERMRESVDLLTTVMDWKQVEEIPTLNANATPSAEVEVPEETRQAILERNGLDSAMHLHANLLLDDALVLHRLRPPE